MKEKKIQLDRGYFNFMRALSAHTNKIPNGVMKFKINSDWYVEYSRNNGKETTAETGYIYYKNNFVGIIRPFGSIFSTSIGVTINDFIRACKNHFIKAMEKQN